MIPGGLGGLGGLDDLGSDEEEDLSHLPPEIKQLREKERRSANNAREVMPLFPFIQMKTSEFNTIQQKMINPLFTAYKNPGHQRSTKRAW